MQIYLKKIATLTLFFLSSLVFGSDESSLGLSQSVPRTMQDIVILINQTQVDLRTRDADVLLLNESTNSSLSKSELLSKYYFKALAAERLGKIDLRVNYLKKALIQADSFGPRSYIVSELAEAQLANGEFKSAVDQSVMVLPEVPMNYLGRSIILESAIVKAYAEAGDFINAQNHMRSVEATFVRLRGMQNWVSFADAWTRNFYQAKAELAFQQGKFEEAEVAFLRALEALEKFVPSSEAMYNPKYPPGIGPNERASSPDYQKARLEELYRKQAEVLLKLRKINEAEYYSREGLKKALQRTGKASVTSSASMRQLAIVMLARERNKDAIFLLDEAIAGLNQSGISIGSVDLARTQKTLASALIADNQFSQALKIYSDLDATIKTYPDVGRFVDINSLDRVLALIRIGDLSQAESRARDFLGTTAKRTGQKSKETADAKLMLATVLASQTKDDEARQLFSAGMVELIALEREVATDSEGLSSKEKKYLAAYIESYLGVLARAYEKSPTLAIASEAFVLGDLARSSGVQKALNASTARANITNPRLAELARKEQDLNQQITFLTRFAKELAMQPANQQLPDVQKKMRADIEQLRQEAKATIRSIEIDFPEYAELISPKPASLERVQKNLKANEVMITWFIGQTSSYVWAIGGAGNPQFKTLKLTQTNLRKDVHTLRKALDPQVATVEEIPAFNFALSHQLYKSLIDPVQSLLEGKTTLVLVPHDEIGQLPLGVLTTSNFAPNPKADLRFSNYRDAPWLIKKYALVTVPSATALTSLRSLPKPKEGRLDYIAFGDPLFNAEQAKVNDKVIANFPSGTQLASRGVPLKLRSSPNTAQVSSAEVSILPRLPDTNDEIQEIAKVFNVDPKRDIYLQKRANLDEVLKANLSNRKVVMFSTHGLVPGELNGLTQPALALTNPEVLGQKGDGLLKVDQILTLKLNADWVVLSACNTAAGEGEGAEALSGLGRAFFYAGARSLLVSSWPVDSQASRKLMTDLFNRQNQDKTLSKPQALQQASLQLLSQGQPDAKEENYSYAHPLFWAPFMMVGD